MKYHSYVKDTFAWVYWVICFSLGRALNSVVDPKLSKVLIINTEIRQTSNKSNSILECNIWYKTTGCPWKSNMYLNTCNNTCVGYTYVLCVKHVYYRFYTCITYV